MHDSADAQFPDGNRVMTSSLAEGFMYLIIHIVSFEGIHVEIMPFMQIMPRIA